MKRIVQFLKQRLLFYRNVDSSPFIRFAPPGHYYSPIPSEQDVQRANQTKTVAIPAVDLRPSAQMQLVKELSQFYKDIPFTVEPGKPLRYFYNNGFFQYSDAIFLHSIIKKLHPRRIIEVGSGFSSAVILDTVEQANLKPELTFIEPYPERLKLLLKDTDASYCKIIQSQVQDCDSAIFSTLAAGDILLIDSSHVSKAGSDVNHLIFKILPILQAGVWIHIHDIMQDFEYYDFWFKEGRAWNEIYLLRAFLMYNNAFEVVLHVPYCVNQQAAWFKDNMPLCLKSPGGSFWLRKL